MENEIFNFTILGPIIVFNSQRIKEVYNQLFDMDVFPIALISDKTNPVFREEDILNSTPKNSNVECIIIPIRYNKEFFA